MNTKIDTENRFFQIARKLGQSVDRLQAGETVQTIVQIKSLDEFKEIFAHGLSEEQRAAISQDLAERHAAALADGPEAHPLVRLVNHMMGNAPLDDATASYVASNFPLKVTVVSDPNMDVTTDITYGPSASPVVLNVGTLTFNGGIGQNGLPNLPDTITISIFF